MPLARNMKKENDLRDQKLKEMMDELKNKQTNNEEENNENEKEESE